jgi:uncharacterized protein YndB with AHSA1/START domain
MQKEAQEMAVETAQPDFEIKKSFKKPVDAVFAALTTPANLTNWWTRASGSGATGGELTFFFGDSQAVMRVDNAERASNVKWKVLLCEPLPDWEGTTLNFELSPDESGGSVVRFRHAGLAQLECFDQCSSAWTHYLGSLVDFVDTGQGDPMV